MKKIFIFILLFCFATPSYSWQFFGQSNIKSTGAIKHGTILETIDGHIFQVNDYVYIYHYSYNSKVIILSEGPLYQLIIDGISKELICKYLGQSGKSTASPPSSNVIKSQIDDDFEGYDDGNVYVLSNGQIWRQTSYNYSYSYSYRPNVIIYKDGSSYYLKVDGMSDSVRVERLK